MACLMGYYLVRPRETLKETLMGALTVYWMVSQMVLLSYLWLVLSNQKVWVYPRVIRMGYLTVLPMVTRKEKQTVHLTAKLLVLPKETLMVPMMENPMDQAMGVQMVHLMEISWVYLMATETVIGMACLMGYYLVRPRETLKETLMGALTVYWMVSQMVLLSYLWLV